jgi:hypothetical protein
MGQQLRAVGWLAFRNQASLEKGLAAFQTRARAGYFDRADWEVEGLVARISLNVDLPGDFLDLDAGFFLAYQEATHGYIDFYESGRTDVDVDAYSGPVWRWRRFFRDRYVPMRDRIRFALAPSVAHLSGSLVFADEAQRERAFAVLPLRIPTLSKDGVVELRIDERAFTIEGVGVRANAIIHWSNDLEKALCEGLGLLAAKAKSGEFVLATSIVRYTVPAGAKKLKSELTGTSMDVVAPADAVAFSVVDPTTTPLPPRQQVPALTKKAKSVARRG